MDDNQEFLRQKARLLIAREREVLALRRKQKRLSLWLSLTQQLPRLIDPAVGLEETCARVTSRITSVLNIQKAAFFELVDALALRPIRVGADEKHAVALDGAAAALLTSQQDGSCEEPLEPAGAALSEAVGMQRFLWYRMQPEQGPLLLVIGFDRERAAFYEGFDADDRAHFANTAQQLELLLRNLGLVRALERENRKLQVFNAELERRVDERTAALAESHRELEGALDVVRRKDAHLEADIERARQFQATILPCLPRAERVEFCALYQPLERVGGDIYDVQQLSVREFRIFLADATGHGVQAAMRTIVIKAEYDRLKDSCSSPHTLLEALGRRLWSLFPSGDVMTTACCLDVSLTDEGAEVSYSNGGNPPLLLVQGRETSSLYCDGPFLGIDAPPFPEPLTFRMRRGDRLFTFSDGLLEQTDEAGAFFEDRLAASEFPAGSATDGLDWLLQSFETFRGRSPVSDDVTLIGLRLTA